MKIFFHNTKTDPHVDCDQEGFAELKKALVKNDYDSWPIGVPTTGSFNVYVDNCPVKESLSPLELLVLESEEAGLYDITEFKCKCGRFIPCRHCEN